MQTTTDAVNISTHELISWAQLIITQRNQYLQNKKHFDIELCYEDIIDDLIDTNDHVKLKKIANYDQLLDELKKLFPEHTYDL